MDFSNKELNQEFATYLRQQREAKQIDLEELAVKIGVPIQHLNAIEKGEFEKFDTFYLKMYIKKYALYLSLDVEDLYQQFYGEQIKQEVEVKMQTQKLQQRNQNVGRLVGVIGAVLVVALGIFYIVDMVKSITPNEEDTPLITNPNSSLILDETVKEETENDVEEEEQPVEIEQEPVTNIVLTNQDGKNATFDVVTNQTEVQLKLEFIAPCWLTLSLGDESLIPGLTYQAGEVFEQTITAEQFEALEFNIGAVTAANIYFNEQLLEYEPSSPHQYLQINLKSE